MNDLPLQELEGRIEGLARTIGILAVRLCQSEVLDQADLLVTLRDRAAAIETAGPVLASAARSMRDLAMTIERGRVPAPGIPCR